MDKPTILKLLRTMQWTGTTRGRGAALFSCCPYCGCLREPSDHFIGGGPLEHRSDCLIGLAVAEKR